MSVLLIVGVATTFAVRRWHMETAATGDTPQELSLNYKFRLIPGVTNLKQYGVYIVKKIWPLGLLDEVYRVLGTFQKRSVVGSINDCVKLCHFFLAN